jgi:hypothetical protein
MAHKVDNIKVEFTGEAVLVWVNGTLAAKLDYAKEIHDDFYCFMLGAIIREAQKGKQILEGCVGCGFRG